MEVPFHAKKSAPEYSTRTGKNEMKFTRKKIPQT
jgi:hypothetical protein